MVMACVETELGVIVKSGAPGMEELLLEEEEDEELDANLSVEELLLEAEEDEELDANLSVEELLLEEEEDEELVVEPGIIIPVPPPEFGGGPTEPVGNGGRIIVEVPVDEGITGPLVDKMVPLVYVKLPVP
jgi:hypothetical protein